MVSDIVDKAAAGDNVQIETLLFGGTAAPGILPKRAKKVFPNTVLFVSRHP